MKSGNEPHPLIQKYGGADALTIAAKLVETMRLHGGLTAEQSILDIGCGPGRMAIAIGEQFAWANRYFGFDVIESDVAFCKGEIAAAYPDFRFEHADVRNSQYNPAGKIEPHRFQFPSADRQFDFAFAASVFTHMRTPETLHYIREAWRCLKPGGRLFATFFCIPESASPTHRFQMTTQLDEHCWTAFPSRPEKAIGFRPDFLQESMISAGFGDVQFYPGAWAGAQSRHNQDYMIATKE